MVFEQRNHALAKAASCCHHRLAHSAHLAYQTPLDCMARVTHPPLPLYARSAANISSACFQHMLHLTLHHPTPPTHMLHRLVSCGLNMGRPTYQLACQYIDYLAWYREGELGHFRGLSLFQGATSCFCRTKPYLITCSS